MADIICDSCYDSANASENELLYFKKQGNICHRICQTCVESYFNNLTHQQIDDDLQITCLFCNDGGDGGKQNITDLLLTVNNDEKRKRYSDQYLHAVKTKGEMAQSARNGGNNGGNEYQNFKKTFQKCILESCPSCHVSILPVENVEACSAITCENCNTIFCKACHYYVDRTRATEFYNQRGETYDANKHERLIHRHIQRKHYNQEVFIPRHILMDHRMDQILNNLSELAVVLYRDSALKRRFLADPDLNTYIQNFRERYGQYDGEFCTKITNILNSNASNRRQYSENRNEGDNYCSLSNEPSDRYDNLDPQIRLIGLRIAMLLGGASLFALLISGNIYYTYIMNGSTLPAYYDPTDPFVRYSVKLWNSVGEGINYVVKKMYKGISYVVGKIYAGLKYVAMKGWAGLKYVGAGIAKGASFTLHHIFPFLFKGLMFFGKYLFSWSFLGLVLAFGIPLLMVHITDYMFNNYIE